MGGHDRSGGRGAGPKRIAGRWIGCCRRRRAVRADSGRARPFGPVSGTSGGGRGFGQQIIDAVTLSPEPYYYESLGRRDPFVSLVADFYVADHLEEQLTPEHFVVRGILWGENDRFALVENALGETRIVRAGDTCGRFRVTRIEPGAIVLYGEQYGVGQTQRLALAGGKGSNDVR
jgi:hypothetical protein